eukprot:TRINITY_DN5084_c0_g1_i1.p1 TRINITY_DN5084_c0_g1~~TRINITY_DN5084_c0_g1_i1.p1  ORF type:complete len:802 (+),score=205.98 TRINITY_DN5084_c0_g1_i1:158-2563(+)
MEIPTKNHLELKAKSPPPSTLHKAAFRGNLSQLQELFKTGKSINAKDGNGTTPLHHAAFKGHLDCLTFLLDGGAAVDAVDKDMCTPLHNAAFTNKLDCARVLIQRGSNIDHIDIDGATPLHKAVFNGNLEVSKLLVESGCKINHADNDGITAVQKATYNDHAHCLLLLLDNKADVNSRDSKGSTGLHKAAFNGFLQCVQILISRGVDVNARDFEDATALHNAVYNGHTEIVNVLLMNGATTNCSTSKYKSTPLHFAAFNGYVDCLKLLLDRGASIESIDAKGMTPLHYAVKRNHEDCVEYLLNKGANVNATDLKRRTWKEFTTSKNMIGLFTQNLVQSPSNQSITPSNSNSSTSVPIQAPPPTPVVVQNGLSATPPKPLLMKSTSQHNPSTGQLKPLQRSTSNPLTRTPSLNRSPSRSTVRIETVDLKLAVVSTPGENTAIVTSPSSQSTVTMTPSASSHSQQSNSDSSPTLGEDIYSKLDRNGFLITKENQNETESRKSQEMKKELKRAIKWTTMIKKWDKVMKKDPKKIKTRCEKGIPARVRGQAWKLLARSTAAQYPIRKTVDYQTLLKGDSEHVVQIQKDVNRTFPKHISLMEQGGQQTLLSVLKAFSVYDPDVGYCQGMGFVSALLLMYMDEEDTFWMLERLSNAYELADLWRPGLPGVARCCAVLQSLMEIYVPKVQQHLQKEDVPFEAYGTKWFMTIFLYNLPFPAVLRVWDIFLFEGFHFLYAVAISLFKIHEDTLLSLSMDAAVKLLNFEHNREPTTPVDTEVLIKTANGYKEKVKRSLKSIQPDAMLPADR